MENDTRTKLCYLIESTPDTPVEAAIFIADHLIVNDVMPVVRCKDCQWFDKTGYDNAHEDDLSLHMGWCTSWRRGTQACAFCSYGERKNDGT